MSPIRDDQVVNYVEANIGAFHDKRLARLGSLKLQQLLIRKNHYLFRSKNLTVATDLIRSLLDAYLSSQEETLFGEVLEGLAVYVAQTVYGGWKSAAQGIDLELIKGDVRYIVSIKSGPNWGNRSQIDQMKASFRTAGQVIRQGNPSAKIVAMNGCCYGRDSKPDKGDYFKVCGQEFWEFVSGDPDFYTRIIEPLGHDAKRRNAEFEDQYARIVNLLSKQFSDGFCREDGWIDWPKLVALGSAKKSPRGRLSTPAP